MAPPSLPKKREVRLPENEDLAGKLLEKYRSMMADQPGSLPEPVRVALSAAYRGLCASKEPIRTLRDLRCTKGVGPWAILVMKDSFPATSPDLSPQQGKKRKYVPQKKSSAYAIVITLYRAMIRGNDSLMKQELIDAAEVSGLSAYGIGPNNTRAKLGSSIKTLISKALIVKWSNPAKYMLTEEGKKTARGCLARSRLDDTAGPLTHHSEKVVMSDSDCDEPYPCDSDCDEPYPCDPDCDEPYPCDPDCDEPYPCDPDCDEPYPCDSDSDGAYSCDSDSDEPAMGSAENSVLAMPHCYSNENFLEAYEMALMLDDQETLGWCTKRNVLDNIHSQCRIPVKIQRLVAGRTIRIGGHKVYLG